MYRPGDDDYDEADCGCPSAPYGHTPRCRHGHYRAPSPEPDPAVEDLEPIECMGCGRTVLFGEVRATGWCAVCQAGSGPAPLVIDLSKPGGRP